MTREERRQIYKNKVLPLFVENKTSAYKVTNDLNESPSLFSRWKNGDAMPKTERLKKIADYFGVPIGYFYED